MSLPRDRSPARSTNSVIRSSERARSAVTPVVRASTDEKVRSKETTLVYGDVNNYSTLVYGDVNTYSTLVYGDVNNHSTLYGDVALV